MEHESWAKDYSVDPAEAGIRTVRELSEDGEKRHIFKLVSKTVSNPAEARAQDRVVRSGRASVEETSVSVAFLLDENHNVLPKEGELYYFVPTTIKSGLKFDINSDFLLNAERSGIDRSLRWNEHLLRAAGSLLIEAIELFRRDKRWRYQFYEVLPTGEEQAMDMVKQTIVDPVLSYCRTHPIVISHTNKWILPSRSAIVPARLQRVIMPAGLSSTCSFMEMTDMPRFRRRDL